MKGDKAGKKTGGYLLLEILICMLLFSVVVFVISVFLKRTVMIEKKKSKTQKTEENIHFLTDKISEDISNRDREVFEYEGSIDNFHIKGNYVLFRKDNLFYKLEYTNKKLYISEGINLLNLGSRTALGEYENLEFKKADRLFMIVMKNGSSEEVKVINLMYRGDLMKNKKRGASLVYVLIILSVILTFSIGFIYFVHERGKITVLREKSDRGRKISNSYMASMEDKTAERLEKRGLNINGNQEVIKGKSDYFNKKFIISTSGQNELKRLLFSDNHEESIGNFKIKEIKDFTGNEYFPPLEENTVYNNLKIVYFKKVLGKEVNYREELEFKRIDSMTVEIQEKNSGFVLN